MSFAREKRLLLGALAVLVPLPLPFNEVIGWPSLLLYWAALAWYFRRVNAGAENWLAPWAMNLLGLLYLPLLLLDLSGIWRGRLLPPLVHLAMYVLVVKLFALHREKDKWHAALGVFFLFLAAIGTSVHIAMVFYLIGFLALWVLVLTRFAELWVIGEYGGGGLAVQHPPLRRSLVIISVLAVLLAVPIFALFPRLSRPYLFTAGGAQMGTSRSTGYSDEMSLSRIGRIRTSRQVALRMRFDRSPPDSYDFRLRGAVYEEFRDNAWHRVRKRRLTLRRRRDGNFDLGPGEATVSADIWLQPLGSASLLLPYESRWLFMETQNLLVDRSGVVSSIIVPPGTVEYKVGLGPGPTPLPELRKPGDPYLDALLQTSGVTPPVERLAAEIMGEGADIDRVSRLTSHLQNEYQYTLDLMGRDEENLIEDFLLRQRRGHCEYFATAMVMMLRSQGIPARVATGFLGADYNPLERYYIVRQSNAHAWVEAYVEGMGWLIADPTPAAGLPASESTWWRDRLDQAWDFVAFRWNRNVLAYSGYDQARAFVGALGWWRRLWSGWNDAPEVRRRSTMDSNEEDSVMTRDEELPDLAPWAGVFLGLAILVLVAALWRQRARFDATRAYLGLRQRAGRRDRALSVATPPLAVRDAVWRHCPPAAEAAGVVIDLYLRESFAGRELTVDERAVLKAAFRDFVRQYKQAA